jgi:hypothetical protein
MNTTMQQVDLSGASWARIESGMPHFDGWNNQAVRQVRSNSIRDPIKNVITPVHDHMKFVWGWKNTAARMGKVLELWNIS